MDKYTGLRFKGLVKTELRPAFNIIAMSGDWNKSTDPVLKDFATKPRASFIPCGALKNMPYTWDFERHYDPNSGEWIFQCSLKNDPDTIGEFFKIAPYLLESVQHAEVFHEDWIFSEKYELIDKLMQCTTTKFIRYQEDCITEPYLL